MVDARLSQRITFGTGGVTADRDHSPHAWFGDSVVLKLMGTSRYGTTEKWISGGMGR